MDPTPFLLKVPEEAAKLIAEGKAHRVGGVVRETGTERIVGFLEDADPVSEGVAGPNPVPLSPNGLSMMAVAGRVEARLDAIQAELAVLRQIVGETRDLAALSSAWHEAAAFGGLVGLLRACKLDLDAGRHELLLSYRRDFLVAHHRLLDMASRILSDSGLLRVGGRLLGALVAAAALAAMVARQLSSLLGDQPGAIQLAEELAASIGGLTGELRKRLRAPSALFWLEEDHLDLVREAREAAARLEGHVERLRSLPVEAEG